jgi:beta-barrel assembly-enhancing protease
MMRMMKRTRLWVAVLGLGVATTACMSAGAISTEQEVRLGAQSAAEINRQLPIITTSNIHNYINELGNSIARQADPRPEIRYTFYVVDSNQVNAFALPGGFIYINRGLIERSNNMSEVAGVLAHEIAHVVHRHGIEQMARMQNAQLGVNLAYILLGRTPGGVEQAGLQVGAGAFFARHSREAEREADASAVQYLAQAGINPQGIVSLFETLLAERQRAPSQVEQWFSTHPLEQERVQNTQALVNALPAAQRQGTTNTAAFRTFQQRLRQMPAARQ